MNKAPQPITGLPSAPHPAPSPGLSQPSFPSGQPTSVVFATPPPQMNPTPQPRQFTSGPRPLHQQVLTTSPYYTNRPNLPPSSGPRGVPPSSAPRPVTPTHVYQPGSQMMVIPGPFPSSPQGPYFVQQQVRNQIVLSITFTLSVPSTAGAYYPAQQFPAGVQPTPVLINPGPQQQQPPPQPPQHMHTKRERKQIRIRDPNRGGRDITEEIMSGGRSGSTPTPPQVSQRCIKPVHYLYVSETFVISLYFKDDRGKPTPPPPSKTPELSEPTPISTEVAASETNNTVSVSEGVDTPLNCNATAAAPAPVSDVMDAPPPAPPREPSPPLQSAPEVPSYPAPLPDPVPSPNAQDEHKASESEEEEEEKMEEALEESAIPSSNGVVESEGLVVTMPSNHLEAPLESPIAQPEELRLPNGLPLPAPQDPNAPTLSAAERDDSPIAEPDLAQQSYNVPAPIDIIQTPIEQTTPVPPEDRDSEPIQEPVVEAEISQVKTEVQETLPPLATEVKEEKVEQVVVKPEPEPEPATAPEPQAPAAPPTPEEADLTWEDKEDKLDAENIQPESVKPSDKKYQYKEEQWKPINMEEKKKYDRAFLLGFQFSSASMNKPVGLPAISDVVLDKANKTPLRQLDPSRLPGMNCGPDFTPSFANLGRPGMGGGGVGGPRRSLQRKEPRKIITTMSLNDDIQLNKAEKAWKPTAKKTTRRGAEEVEENDPDQLKTQELFKRVRSILNKLTPQKFQQLMKQVTELTIDTEERLKGVIDLTFEKAISEPDFSVAYANMCRCLMGLKVPATDKPGTTVNFRKLLLNRCQKEFEKDKDDDEIFEKKQKELEAASNDEEKQRLTDELTDAKDKARRRSLGNIKFIGELFKLKMLTEVIMHDCIVKLLKNHDEESLECLCRLLSTIGKDLDFEKAKPRMDQYFTQMEKIIKEKKTSSRIRFMLQDVLDLRRSNWVPRRGDQGPKTIDQIHKEAEMEEQREQMKVQQALISKKDTGGGPGGRGGPHTPGRGQPPQDEGWNTVPISKNRPIDTSRLSKITKVPWNLCLEKEMYGKQSRLSILAQISLKQVFLINVFLPMQEALQCVQELNSPQLLFVFVRNGLESTLERSTMGREHLGLLLHQLVKAGILSKPQYFKGLQEILEVADDMAIDIPHIWLYLAELITPMLHEGGIPMGELFREVAKPLIPLEKAGVLLVQILTLLCKGMSHKKAGAMWREAGLKWKDYLPEDEDVNKFVTEKNVEFTLGEESEKSQPSEMSSLELTNHLDRLIQDQADNQRIFDWIDANLDEKQTSSNMFVRALMTCICQSAIICENPYKVSVDVIKQRGKLLLKFLKDEQKELQALYALQALMVQMEQPANLLRMFFDALYDEDVIKEEAFYKWESSKDPAEQTGKGVALKSVTAFFTWLREAEDESDNS
uniref:Eukaryotic translation initiation factor 4 gamma 1 n=1 Tax=Neogobius melanostomus TaxID=47308 RepID=A0A8C6TKQ6_9GOBI